MDQAGADLARPLGESGGEVNVEGIGQDWIELAGGRLADGSGVDDRVGPERTHEVADRAG